MSLISVAVIDDLPLMRQALTSFIEKEPKFELVAEGEDGQDALKIAETLHPDVFLMDLQMPVMDGVQAAQRILEKFPQTKILAITTFYSDHFVVPAMRAGVHGYLLKDARPQEIVNAIFAAVRGQTVLSKQALETLMSSLGPICSRPSEADTEWTSLTDTEQKVLQSLCKGLNNKDIAEELFISESTVKSTVSRIMHKLNVSSRLQILVKAHQHFLIQR